MGKSKKHHFISQWQMKLWSNDKEQVYAVLRHDKDNIKGLVTSPKNVNSQNYLYTIRDKAGRNNDFLEKKLYGPLDNVSCKLTLDILDALEKGLMPDLDVSARETLWQYYIYNAFKRHPCSFDPYLDVFNYEELRVKTLEKLVLNEASDDELNKIRKLSLSDLKKNMKEIGVQYARAEQNNIVIETFGKMNIIFGLAPKKKSFILPDRAFEINSKDESKELWVPISPKVSIRQLEPQLKNNDKVVPLSAAKVRDMNETWYQLSNTSISISSDLLTSLSNVFDEKKVFFNEC